MLNISNQTWDEPSVCPSPVWLKGSSALPLVHLYVMGSIPTARQGRTTKAPIRLLTRLEKVTMIGLTKKWGRSCVALRESNSTIKFSKSYQQPWELPCRGFVQVCWRQRTHTRPHRRPWLTQWRVWHSSVCIRWRHKYIIYETWFK